MKMLTVILMVVLVWCTRESELAIPIYPKPLDLPKKPLVVDKNPEEKPVVVDKKPEEKPIVVDKKPVVVDKKPVEKPKEDPKFYVSNPDSLSVLINKNRYLPDDYVPKLKDISGKYASRSGMKARPEVVDAFILMADDLYHTMELEIQVMSSYRTMKYQQDNFDRYAKKQGIEEARRSVAPAGASEHNAGLALDIIAKGGTMDDFGATPHSDWVKENAHNYGFIIRYEGKYESITGFLDEPWHLRYLGVDLAKQVYETGKPLELFENLP